MKVLLRQREIYAIDVPDMDKKRPQHVVQYTINNHTYKSCKEPF